MLHLLLTPESIRVLALVILNAAITFYLWRTGSGSGATIWLAVFTGGMALFYLMRFIMDALFPLPPLGVLQLTLSAVELLAVPVSLGALVQFAYRFLENPFPREARVALWLIGGTFAAVLGLVAITFAGSMDTFGIWGPAYSLVWLVFSAWAAVVLLRKRKRCRVAAPVPGHKARAYLTFAALCGFFVALLVAVILTFTSNGLGSVFWPYFILPGVYAFFFGLVAAYINHAQVPTSFQVKLVGLSLATVLALFGMMAVLMGADWSYDSGVLSPGRRGVRFDPDDQGGYRITEISPVIDEEWGPRLALPEGPTLPVELGFDFPFAGARWDRVTVDAFGLVAFGAGWHPPAVDHIRSADLHNPLIAPLYFQSLLARQPDFFDTGTTGMPEGLAVYRKAAPEHLLLTWQVTLPQPDLEPLVVQLELQRDGAIEMRFGELETHYSGIEQASILQDAPYFVRGFLFPEEAPYFERSLTKSIPMQLPARVGIIDDFMLEIRHFVHVKALRLLTLMLIALGFILVVFPLVFRSSLIRPLQRLQEGMRHVNEGDLETEIPVGVQDEVGRLTEYFNETTRSLRRAEQELRTYAEHLEERVEERTAALNQSLQDLKATQAQLVQQEKLASLGQLTAGIAHEIKNPLNFINNFAEVNQELAQELREALQSGEDLETIIDDLERNAAVIAQHGRRADGIVKSMMQHASGTEGRREATDVNALVAEHIELAYHGKRAQVPGLQVKIKRDLADDGGTVEFVPQEIGRVLLNLLSNAFDAVHERAEAENGAYVPMVTVSTRRAGGQVEIRVEDNGVGVPREAREHIFEPFYTTKPTGSGTGLGLSLSYDIVTQGHGGTLTLESEPGQGAAFTVALPAHSKEETTGT